MYILPTYPRGTASLGNAKFGLNHVTTHPAVPGSAEILIVSFPVGFQGVPQTRKGWFSSWEVASFEMDENIGVAL